LPAAAPPPVILPTTIAALTAWKAHMHRRSLCGQLATNPVISRSVCLKNERKNFVKECRIYNPAVSDPEGKDNLHATSCPFFKRLIRASYKFKKENVFVSIRAFMHIGLLLMQRPRNRADSGVIAWKQ
jgi:hypothetical protein